MKKMNRVLATVLLAALVVSLLPVFAGNEALAAEKKETGARAIYVVFDNSGSMYTPGNVAWSQATYAMEVFAAMMNYENGDEMKIFPMHDVTTDGGKGGRTTSSITVKSIQDIKQIHDMYTPKPLGTPYTQVNVAANELASKVDGDEIEEGWLVILTDGDFDKDLPAGSLKDDLEKKAQAKENMSVQFLAMGKDAKTVPPANESIGLYSQRVNSSSEVIDELAVISNRIFKRNVYMGYKNDGKLKFDVPLGRLIVFAQGDGVSVNSLTSEEGSEIAMESNYQVSCSSTEGAGKTNFVTETPAKDTSLKGQVAVFTDSSSIKEGEYTLDVENADSIQVYYEPDVSFGIGVYLGGKPVDKETIGGGVYEVRVGFINRLTGEFIEDTSMLGEPEYTLYVNGEEYGIGGGTGAYQSVEIQVDGDELQLLADVSYLNNYTDHKEMSFKVCTMDMTVGDVEDILLKELETATEGLLVEVTKNGKPLTEEQWQSAVVEVDCKDSEGEPFEIEWVVTKGSQPSTWTITPKYKDGDMFSTDTGKAEVTVTVTADIDGEQYGQFEKVSMNVIDDRTFVDYLKRYWKHILAGLLILILVLGYVPPFKRRFSPRMKRRPSIECASQKIGVQDSVVKGKFKKEIWSVLLPYKAESGSLTFSPAPVKNTAKLKAMGKGRMQILNTKNFAGKSNVMFNGMSIQEGQTKNHQISISTIITVETVEFVYTCIPNVQRTADGRIKRGGKKGKKK